jgi:hypothetical protein
MLAHGTITTQRQIDDGESIEFGANDVRVVID